MTDTSQLTQYEDGVKALREASRQYHIGIELLSPFYWRIGFDLVINHARLDDYINKMEAMLAGVTVVE